MEKKIGFSTYLTILIGVLMLVAAIDSLYMPFMAAVYPGIIAGVCFVLAIAQVIQDFRKGQTTSGAIDIAKSQVESSVRYRKGLRVFAWIMGSYLSILLIGFKLGTVVFVGGYLYFEDKSRWLKILITCACVFLILDFFGRFLEVWWPSGFLGDLVEEYVPSLMSWFF